MLKKILIIACTSIAIIITIVLINPNLKHYVENIKHGISPFSYASILPVFEDKDSELWVYFAIEPNSPEEYVILGGRVELNDTDIFHAAKREMNEEALDIFDPLISIDKLRTLSTSHCKLTVHSLFGSNATVFVASLKKHTMENCPDLMGLYTTRRYAKIGDYKKLTYAQTEISTIAVVKLKDLISYLENKHEYLIGISGQECNSEKKLKVNYKTTFVLKNNLKKLKHINFNKVTC